MTKKKKQSQKKEICWNIINSLLAGALVLVGSFSNGEFSWKGMALAFVASSVVAITQFKQYWDGEKNEYCTKLFNFTPHL